MSNKYLLQLKEIVLEALKMERLKLKEILKEPYSIIIRDATIQRFEYTFEAFWKFIKEYLKQEEGKISNYSNFLSQSMHLMLFV